MLLTTDDLALFFEVTKPTISTWRDSGDFPKPYMCYRHFIRWRSADIAEWLGIPEEEFLQLLHEKKQSAADNP
jgi:predicted DNA-binding transcriptional regulator AlpA